LLTIMKHFDFAVGMRLHFLIFAALQGVPLVALPYSEKVSGLLEELHIAMPPIELVNEGRLLAHIDQSWDRRSSIKTAIERGITGLKKRALETNKLLVDLLSKRS